MSLPEQFRTTSFRLAVGYAFLFIASVLVIMGTTYLAATSEIEGLVRSSIKRDMAAFRSAFAEGGLDALQEQVQERAEGAPNDRFFLILDPQDRLLAGNIDAGLWRAGWANRKLGEDGTPINADLPMAASQNKDGEVQFYSYGETIEGNKVFAARNSHILDETQEIILSSLLWGCLATTLLALIGGYIVSNGPTRRVDDIARTTRRIVAGHLHLRLPVSTRKDELDRLATDINGMLAQIEILMQSLKQVSTDIAHDLRTPLTRLRQGLDTVRREPQTDKNYEDAIEDAIAQTDAIIETFNALLRIAQIEAGARRARFKRTDLSALAEKLYDFYLDVAADEGHSLNADIAAEIAVDGDADLLSQLIANLIENAINHTPAPSDVTISLYQSEDETILAVGDNGPGVPEDERARIFRRLYRLDRSRTTPGSGLGLALVAAIVDLHGARIEALDNRPGLLMQIRFPRRPAPPSEEDPRHYETV